MRIGKTPQELIPGRLAAGAVLVQEAAAAQEHVDLAREASKTAQRSSHDKVEDSPSTLYPSFCSFSAVECSSVPHQKQKIAHQMWTKAKKRVQVSKELEALHAQVLHAAFVCSVLTLIKKIVSPLITSSLIASPLQ